MFEVHTPLLDRAFHTQATVEAGQAEAAALGSAAKIKEASSGWIITVIATAPEAARAGALEAAEAALLEALATLIALNG